MEERGGQRAAGQQARPESHQELEQRGQIQKLEKTTLLKICYTNARSLPGKINELAAYASVSEPDIILICESWCNSTITNSSLSIPGYQLETDLRKDRQDTGNGVGGGLIVYSKLGLKLLSCDKFQRNAFNQFCAFSVRTTGQMLNIILTYRPPTSSMDNLLQLCEILRNLEGNSFVIGDINLPIIDWEEGKADARGRRLMDTVEEEGLAQLVDFSTHDKGNRLDLLITNCQNRIVSVYDDGKLGNSDHCIIGVELIIPHKTSMNKRVPNWNKAKFPELRNHFRAVDWQNNLNGDDIEADWKFFSDTIAKTVANFVPCSTSRPADRPKWINRDIIKLIRRKKRAWQTAKAHKTIENLEIYKKLEKEVSNKVRNAKRNLEKKLAFSKGGNNTRVFANYIKSKTKSKVCIGPLKDSGRIISENKEMADKLNEFFSSVFSEEDLLNLPPQWYETNKVLEGVSITVEKIQKKLKNLKEKSAPGPDNICPGLLKNAAAELSVPLKIIYEKSIRLGQVPADWKQATVTPIFKKGTKGDASNYRPVSLTSVPCKILESLIKDCITEHLEAEGLIKNSQHGAVPPA